MRWLPSVFSIVTILWTAIDFTVFCGIIAAKQLLYPSYGQDDAQAEPAPVPMANYTISLRDYGIIAAKQAIIPELWPMIPYTQGLDLACIPVPDPILKREEQHHVNRKNPDL